MEHFLTEVSIGVMTLCIVALVKMLWELHADNREHKVTIKNHGERIGVIEKNVFEVRK